MRRTRMTVIRHSKASPAVEGADDNTRSLSYLGVEIAERRHTTCGGPFDLGIASDRKRAIETLCIVGGFSPSDPRVLSFDELYTPQSKRDEALINAAYAHIGSAPLGEFLGQCRIDEHDALRNFARDGWNLVESVIDALENVKNILVVSHEIFAQYMLWNGSDWSNDFNAALLERRWDVCDGVEVVIEDSVIVSVTALPSVVEEAAPVAV